MAPHLWIGRLDQCSLQGTLFELITEVRWHAVAVDYRLKVLVVDDEPLISALLRQTLEAAGHEVEVANKGAEATKLAKSFDPDLVLMDVDLGSGPDGIDVASSIKFQSPSVSIAFLTNVSEPRLTGK